MALTTPLLRLFPTDQARRSSVMLRSFLLAFVVLTGSLVSGCGSGEEGGPSASATLSWDPVDGVQGYYVYYGTESQGSGGSCAAYHNKVFTPTPSATVTGLTPNTHYYFAVTSFNGVESECSGEAATDSGEIDPVIIG